MREISILILEKITVCDSILEPGKYSLECIISADEPHQSKLKILGREDVIALSLGWWYIQSHLRPSPLVFLEGKECLDPIHEKLNSDLKRMSNSTYKDNPFRGIAARHL